MKALSSEQPERALPLSLSRAAAATATMMVSCLLTHFTQLNVDALNLAGVGLKISPALENTPR